MKRFWIQTFGCQMNAHDSRRIAEVLFEDGYAACETPEAADLIVLNTCSVREKAEHKLLSALGTLRPLKEQNAGLMIAVAGCMVQEHGAGLLARSDLIDVMVGPDNIGELAGLLQLAETGGYATSPRAGATRVRAEFDLETPQFLRATPRPGAAEAFAYVTVMKGCDERCSFCIVPYTRGPERYRPAAEIVAEVSDLARGGVREITLVGQTVNSWQEPGSAAEGESRFAELLRTIASATPELARLRYTSPHPRHVTSALCRAHAELELLPAHVHLPMQSGSDRVLKRMIRRYTRESYLERARALQAARKGLTLSTDIIVGFPGETEDDFKETLTLCEEVGFVAAFGFKYSPRPNTPALKLGDDVGEAQKTERLARLFELVDRLQLRHLQSLVGSRTRVLFEGKSKSGEGRFVGRSERHEIVHAGAPPASDLTGQLLEVRITEANKRSLVGELIDAPRVAPRGRSALHLPVLPL